jgi:peptidoglycan/xylan/chitin deacetylase (PgdA/CDA1 family)
VTRWSQAEADINAAIARSSRGDITARPVLETISSVATTEPIAALTFDDGPHPRHTPKLLEILKRYNAKATFFMVGKVASRYPELVKAVADAGHVIGNHSWDHPSFPSLTRSERLSQVLRCAAALNPYGYTYSARHTVIRMLPPVWTPGYWGTRASPGA